MAENDAAKTAETEPSPTGSPTGEAPTSAPTTSPEPKPPAAAQETGFRFQAGPGIPEFAVGKTAAEVASLAGDMYQELVRGGSLPASAMPQQPQYGGNNGSPPIQQQPAGPQPPTEDDWLNNPGEAARRQFAYEQATTVNPRLQQQATAMAQQARELVRFSEQEAFSRWGPEIDMLINQMQPEYRTTENIKVAVGIVKSRHLDELAEERAKAKLQQMQEAAGMRSDGAAGGGSAQLAESLNLEKAELPPAYRRQLERHGITLAVLDEFLQDTECRARGIPLQQARKEWLEKAQKGDIITEHPATQTETR